MMSDTNTATPPDRAALESLGAAVRTRLAQDPSAYRLPAVAGELFVFQDFLSPAECTAMIAMVDAVAQPSATFDPDHQNQYRTSFSGNVDPYDPFVRMIERRIDDLLGIDPDFGETVQGQRYTQGQEFQLHCDWFQTDQAYWPAESRGGGQRSWTAMAYLNDVEAGGATYFPHLYTRVTPQAGMLLVWNNAHIDGTPNTYTLHAAEPVERGQKYVITKWYRTRAWAAKFRALVP